MNRISMSGPEAIRRIDKRASSRAHRQSTYGPCVQEHFRKGRFLLSYLVKEEYD